MENATLKRVSTNKGAASNNKDFEIKKIEEDIILIKLKAKKDNELILRKTFSKIKESNAKTNKQINVIRHKILSDAKNNENRLKKHIKAQEVKLNTIVYLAGALIISNVILFATYIIS